MHTAQRLPIPCFPLRGTGRGFFRPQALLYLDLLFFGNYAASRGGSRRLATGDPTGGTATAGDCFRGSSATKRAGSKSTTGSDRREARGKNDGAGATPGKQKTKATARARRRTTRRRATERSNATEGERGGRVRTDDFPGRADKSFLGAHILKYMLWLQLHQRQRAKIFYT